MIPQSIQEPYEIDKLVELYKKLAPKRVLEIGTEAGGTLYLWATHATPGTTVVSVDHAHRDGYKETQHLFKSWCAEDVEMELVVGYSQDPETIEKYRAFGPYDFVFIDGDHSYTGVKQDWETVREMTRFGGAVAFHDIAADRDTGPCQVYKLWDELVASGLDHVEFIAPDPVVHGRPLGIGVIFL